MHVDWSAQISGLPIKSIRDWLRKLRDKPFTSLSFSQTVCLPRAESESLIAELMVRGWIELVRDSKQVHHAPDIEGLDSTENSSGSGHRARYGRQCFAISEEGIRFSTKKMIRPISRQRAEMLLNEVVSRARDANDRADLTHYVKELRVFGSYLGENDYLGDLDIAANITLRDGVKGEAMIAHAKASGKRFRNFVEELTYGFTEVKQLLKNRSRAISLHDISELDELGCASRVVFFGDSPKRSDEQKSRASMTVDEDDG